MKCLKLAIAIALSSGLTAATALAQTPVQRTGFEYGSYDYYAQDAQEDVTSPGDKAVDNGDVTPPPAPDATPAADEAPTGCASACTTACEAPKACDKGCNVGCEKSCNACDSCNSCNACCEAPLECETCDPWRLFSGKDCCGCEHSWSATGWVNGGITLNGDAPDDHFNGPVLFNDRDDGQMNQFYAVLANAAETDSCDWNLGGRVDLMYGTDSRFLEVSGMELEDDGDNHWNTSRFYRLSMPQAYAEIGGNDWSIKVGRFYTIIGYEVVTAPDNFFYSHSYSFGYGEPFTHTGVLATKTLSDQVSITGGVHNGWDTFDDDDDQIGFLGGINWTSCDGKEKLAIAASTGDEDTFAGGEETTNRTMYSIVYTRNMSDRWTYIFQHDLGIQNDFQDPTLTDETDAEWYSINQYLIYKINCEWSAGVRGEWYRDDDGVRVAGNTRSGNPYAGGSVGDFWEITAGLNYKPTANFAVRPEVRYDWFDGEGTPPFDNNTEDDQFTAALDVIFLW